MCFRYLLIIVHLIALIARVSPSLCPSPRSPPPPQPSGSPPDTPSLHRFKIRRVPRRAHESARRARIDPIAPRVRAGDDERGAVPCVRVPRPRGRPSAARGGRKGRRRRPRAQSPLHVAAKNCGARGGMDVVAALLGAGAHLDACNAARKTPMGLLAAEGGAACVVTPLKYVTLKCLAARKVVECGVEFGDGRVSRELESFVRMH